jgi:hypothetical protein
LQLREIGHIVLAIVVVAKLNLNVGLER